MKKFVFFSIILAFILLLTGCSKKSAITTSKFRSIVESNGYIVSDDYDSYSSYNYFNEAFLASKDDCDIQFFVLDNANNAKDMFNTNKSKFESSKSGMSTEVSTSLGNYDTYLVQTNGYYKYVSRVDNTLLYVNVPMECKESVKTIIDSMKY